MTTREALELTEHTKREINQQLKNGATLYDSVAEWLKILKDCGCCEEELTVYEISFNKAILKGFKKPYIYFIDSHYLIRDNKDIRILAVVL